MTELGAFTSYDLGRVLESLRAARAELPKQPPAHAFRAALVDHLSFDHGWRECWRDPTFLPRYYWLRDALAIATSPDLNIPIQLLDALLDQLLVADRQRAGDDDEPF